MVLSNVYISAIMCALELCLLNITIKTKRYYFFMCYEMLAFFPMPESLFPPHSLF